LPTRSDRARSLLDDAHCACEDLAADPETVKEAAQKVQRAREIVAGVRAANLPVTRKAELDETVDAFERLARQHATPSELNSFENKTRSAERLIGNSAGEFDNVLDEMRGSIFEILWRQDDFVAASLDYFKNRPYLFPNQKAYEELIASADEASERNDYDELRRIIGKLHSIKAASSWADELRRGNIIGKQSAQCA